MRNQRKRAAGKREGSKPRRGAVVTFPDAPKLPAKVTVTTGALEGCIIQDGAGRKLQVMRAIEAKRTRFELIEGASAIEVSDVALKAVIASLRRVLAAE